MLIRVFAFVAFFSPFALADVQFTSPAAGQSFPAGSPITVTWQDSGVAPPLSDLSGYTILLMVGGDTVATSQQVLTSPASIAGSHTQGTSITFTIGATAGPPDPLAYFLQITSAPASGTGILLNYSPRFTLSGMTGAWPSPAIQAAFTAAGAAVPPTSNGITAGNAAPGDPAGAGAGPFSVSYQFQTTGLTKYAPMQPKPGSKITATNTAPLFQPSGFTVATTFLPSASFVTTLTQAVTYSVSSRENTASPAPMPSDDMQRFLARWRD